MKGIVVVEFMDMVDGKFSIETGECLLGMSDLPSKGIYTTVGTYSHMEMVTLVGNLSKLTNIPVPQLLTEFGEYLFGVFAQKFPSFFPGIKSTTEFLALVQSYVHLEVRKFYADAELPTFLCSSPQPDVFIMKYQSVRNLPDFAEGLILGCMKHFQEEFSIEREALDENPPAVVFTLTKRNTSDDGQ